MHRSILSALLLAATPLTCQSLTWTRTGPPINDGYEAVRVGDIDQDGHDDLVVKIYLSPLNGGTAFDMALWFFSGRDGTLLRQGQRVLSNEGILPLSYAGDWDNDGVGDYVMALGVYPCSCSALEVRSGATDQTLWRLARPWPEEWFWFAMGDIDIDGDGLSDIVTATPFVRDPNQTSGYGLIYGFDHFGNILWQRRALPLVESIGHDIAKYGDYDGDGCDDFLLGVGGPNGFGAVEITSGRTGPANCSPASRS